MKTALKEAAMDRKQRWANAAQHFARAAAWWTFAAVCLYLSFTL